MTWDGIFFFVDRSGTIDNIFEKTFWSRSMSQWILTSPNYILFKYSPGKISKKRKIKLGCEFLYTFRENLYPGVFEYADSKSPVSIFI